VNTAREHGRHFGHPSSRPVLTARVYRALVTTFQAAGHANEKGRQYAMIRDKMNSELTGEGQIPLRYPGRRPGFELS